MTAHCRGLDRGAATGGDASRTEGIASGRSGNTAVSAGIASEPPASLSTPPAGLTGSLTRSTRSSSAPLRIRIEERIAHSTKNIIVVMAFSPCEPRSYFL